MALDKKRLLHQARKMMDSSAKEKALQRETILTEIQDVKDAIKALNTQVDALRNLKATEGARLEAVKAERAVLFDKLKALEEELDGTAERRRIEEAFVQARAKVGSRFAVPWVAITGNVSVRRFRMYVVDS
jgi:chromosome segregation ATPase